MGAKTTASFCNRPRVRVGSGLLALCLGSLTFSVDAGQPGFSDQTAAAQLIFEHAPETTGVPYPMSGGVTVGDFNRDGWPDLFALGGGLAPDALFINNGNGTFTDEAMAWGLVDLYRGIGAATGDYDGDGWTDVFVSSFGDVDQAAKGGQHRLYHNNGNGTFTDLATAAGVNFTSDQADSYGPVWGDYDLDGDLDLWVAAWGVSAPTSKGSRLFRNDGDGTFTNATTFAGVRHDDMHAFGGIFADMNGDRYPELLVAADVGTSRYFVNNRDGTFTETDIFLPDKVYNGMGHTVADFDRDGLYDWFVTSIIPRSLSPAPGNRLYRGLGADVYDALPFSGGVNDGGFGWGAAAIDFDHDGWIDIAHTNGFPLPDPITGESYENARSRLFRNNGDLTFTDVAENYGIDHTGDGRALVHFDYDRDGDMDIVIFTYDGSLALYRNDLAGDDVNWLKVYLDTGDSPGLAGAGRGAKVTIAAGGVTQRAQLTGGANFLGNSEMVAHFGLADATTVQRVIVNWPDGTVTLTPELAVNQSVSLASAPPLSVTPVPASEDVQLQVTGLAPTEVAHFFFGTAGDGPCFAFFGGLCLSVTDVAYAGNATADANGIALRVATPPTPGAETIFVQAMLRRGAGGTYSISTNPAAAD